MGGGGAGRARARVSWRALAASALALWLLAAALALAPLWLPPLCCAVAAVRFRRARESELRAARRSHGISGCGGERGREKEEAAEGARHRARLLHRYLGDQVELVLAGGGGGAAEDGDRAPADP
ncbi:hypothetical protein BS78_08G046300 [Paspalum vaginatum]|nr:hypothetical protein BS78_08G046300 [Paspalum vaginatum]